MRSAAISGRETRMQYFLDVNTIWRRKFAGALARQLPTTPIAPHRLSSRPAEPTAMDIVVPPGWATKTSSVSMPYLAHRIKRDAASRGMVPSSLFLTIPHYAPLADLMVQTCDVIYYCSDDYRTYARWDTAKMRRLESRLCRQAKLSIFVSEALRSRAVNEYDLDPNRTFVSPNATEATSGHALAAPELAALPRPILGCAGVISERLDLALLEQLASLPQVGALAMVGPVDAKLQGTPLLKAMQRNEKIHFFGRQPHGRMSEWMAGFDVAVIPYAETTFNHFCSPMRLYDHLAIGHPIIATEHCDQIRHRKDIEVVKHADLSGALRAIEASRRPRNPRLESWDDRVKALVETGLLDIHVEETHTGPL